MNVRSDASREQIAFLVYTKANARLIAAAPELLAACESTAEMIGRLGLDRREWLFLAAAIAKATTA